MILKREIVKKASDWQVPPFTVDKDYVLGHFLNSFFSFGENRDLFVFKGGTCLKKCYFSDYRFSEDLDFTLLDRHFPITKDYFQAITDSCYNDTGILFHLKKIEQKRHLDIPKGYNIVIDFWGANHNKNVAPAPVERWTTKIEIDITFDEAILFPVNDQQILHLYSDVHLINDQTIPVYSLEEILIEKVRSFYQRSYKAPRDFYDVWYLLSNISFHDWPRLTESLERKCALKNKMVDTMIFEDEKIYTTISKSWNNSILNHLSREKFINFDEVWYYLKSKLFIEFFNL